MNMDDSYFKIKKKKKIIVIFINFDLLVIQ